jgi:hypothetical protein
LSKPLDGEAFRSLSNNDVGMMSLERRIDYKNIAFVYSGLIHAITAHRDVKRIVGMFDEVIG